MDREICPTHGGPIDECPDDQRDWFPQRSICWPTAMLAVANRQYDHLHEGEPWHDGTFTIFGEKFSKVTPWHYRDGVSIYLSESDENPADDFTTNKSAKLPSAAGPVKRHED